MENKYKELFVLRVYSHFTYWKKNPCGTVQQNQTKQNLPFQSINKNGKILIG